MTRSLVLLSGEGTTIPEAEARTLFLAYDPRSRFSRPEKRLMVAESEAVPSLVGRRIAFARRVGLMIDAPEDASRLLKGKKVRMKAFRIGTSKREVDPRSILRGLDIVVELTNPDFELTVIDGERRYYAVTVPNEMSQAWHLRRPRSRAYFHPSAIFPKLSRAIVNLTRCKEGQVLLDPFAGTGSILLEASLVGAQPLAVDQTAQMCEGSLANMNKLAQHWLGVIRADAFALPLTQVDAIATDTPYGRASSARGSEPTTVVRRALELFPRLLKSGSRIVMMHPKEVAIQNSSELVVEEEHHLYVHKKLTRTITVLRRN